MCRQGPGLWVRLLQWTKLKSSKPLTGGEKKWTIHTSCLLLLGGYRLRWLFFCFLPLQNPDGKAGNRLVSGIQDRGFLPRLRQQESDRDST